MRRKRIAIISTGGTIEKTYDEMGGVLANRVNVLDILMTALDLRGIDISRIPLMNKDSTEMSEDDHSLIAQTAGILTKTYDGVVVVHGTDTMQISGEETLQEHPNLRAPIIFTGAMRPYELRNTDAIQNMTEALLAAQLLPPGVYVVMHNKVLSFPGVIKDPTKGTFVQSVEPKVKAVFTP